MKLTEVEDGVRINTLELGAGDPILLLHGWSLSLEVWDRQIRVLAEAGYRVIAMDTRGHGRSDAPLSGYDIDHLAADAFSVLTAYGVHRAHVVGWSLGGMVALRMAHRAPERVSGVVMVASNGVAGARQPGFPFGAPPEGALAAILAAEHLDRVSLRRSAVGDPFGTPPDPGTLDWLHRISLQTPSWAAMGCMKTLLCTNQTQILDTLVVPVSQIVGRSDPAMSSRGAHWVQKRLASSLTELDCGHYPMLECPDEFDNALLRALATTERIGT